jgi:hypothetical protein
LRFETSLDLCEITKFREQKSQDCSSSNFISVLVGNYIPTFVTEMKYFISHWRSVSNALTQSKVMTKWILHVVLTCVALGFTALNPSYAQHLPAPAADRPSRSVRFLVPLATSWCGRTSRTANIVSAQTASHLGTTGEELTGLAASISWNAIIPCDRSNRAPARRNVPDQFGAPAHICVQLSQMTPRWRRSLGRRA